MLSLNAYTRLYGKRKGYKTMDYIELAENRVQ
jgi:hypothetical protein